MTTRYGQLDNFAELAAERIRSKQRPDGEPLRILNEENWSFWRENGYLHLQNVAPAKLINPVIDLIWEFQEMDPNDPESWYRRPPARVEMEELNFSGMVEVYNHQALWDVRQYPVIHQVFADLWGTEKLWVTIDRVNLNLPTRPGNDFEGFIHWDIDTGLDPIPAGVQGVLSLSDSTIETGGFQCVPEIYRNYDEWVRNQPADRNTWMPEIDGFEVVQIETKAGDLMIWDSLLPHGIRPNRSNKPRLAMYISMFPAQENNEELRQWRISSWSNRIAPEGMAFPGDPRRWEQNRYQRAELNELGEKLLGLREWGESRQ
ncbi:MAG: phytanoyl-CoA dioxygenase family protein [Acidobacteria bacterium]|nr:phytanoyl-CoA dioxygenase family protein [Acidobacteriota bacterium]